MNGKRQKKNKTLTGTARALAAVGVILSILSIQQVWAQEFCTCDQNPPAFADAHCSKHATQHQNSGESHSVAPQRQTGVAEHCGVSHSLSSHHHAAEPQHRDHTESVTTSAPTNDDSDYEPGFGNSLTARLELGANPRDRDATSTPKLDCCHVLPTANLPAASLVVYSAYVTTDSASVVFDSAPATTVIPATVFHPPPSRPIYVKVSSFLI